MESSIKNHKSSISNPQAAIQFSQGALQDYVDCPRRFQLRYLLKVAWPALEAEPVQQHESAMQQGELFHRLIQQHLLGIPAERLTPLTESGSDEEENRLSRWWQNYLSLELPASVGRFPEVTLSMPLMDSRLVAKYDLLLITADERFIIYDWKTSAGKRASYRRPKRSWLLERLQTRVYPYLLVQAGSHLIGGKPIQPEQVQMTYWFAEAPQEPEIITYTHEQFANDEAYLKNLIAEIQRSGEDDFFLTQRTENCRFCTYRSLCDRGVTAGDLEDANLEVVAEVDVGFDFDQIAEIAF